MSDCKLTIDKMYNACIMQDQKTMMLPQQTFWSLLWVFSAAIFIDAADYQPRTILTIEKNPSRMVFGSLSMPQGSPWCQGLPTYWLIGHQPHNETPWCLQPANKNATLEQDEDDGFIDYSNSVWVQNSPAIMDTQDPRNDDDNRSALDRHQCTTMDVNMDGVPDIVCGVGANKGKGYGYNEVYLTTNSTSENVKTNPSKTSNTNAIVKVLYGHGLDKYTTMRNRITISLKAADGAQLVFLATLGIRREDNQTNAHRLFRHAIVPGGGSMTALNSTHSWIFKEVKLGPWNPYTRATCLLVADLNNDGIDDLIMCNQFEKARIMIQNNDNTWSFVPVKGHRSKKWRQARLADVNGDGIADLIVVGYGGRWPRQPKSWIRIFAGQHDAPYFDFAQPPLYQRALPYASPDLEILDVNRDGFPDVYVVQADELTPDTYCAGVFDHHKFYSGGIQPPDAFVPPVDQARDLLLVHNNNKSATRTFDPVWMNHALPGCGAKVEAWDNHTMILAQGTTHRAGHNLLLQW